MPFATAIIIGVYFDCALSRSIASFVSVPKLWGVRVVKLSKPIGVVIGLLLFAGAVYSVMFVDWRTEPPVEPTPVRPLKTIVVGVTERTVERRYPGKVRPNEEVSLAFQVNGRLIELPVKKGQDVAEGELLGRLDPRDFENELAARVGIRENAESEYNMIKQLESEGNATFRELTQKKALYDKAVADEKIAAKALEDTSMRAPFAGVIADRYVENFQNVTAKEVIVSLQDVKDVEIEVSIPEETIALYQKSASDNRFLVTFDYLPSQTFEATVKEFSTEADPLTQTFQATFVMPAPADVNILPGMTATVTHVRSIVATDDDRGFPVPIEAVPVDGVGQYFVWRINPKGDKAATVRRVDVTVGELLDGYVVVERGLSAGDRIAAAGVHVLSEGQQVRPMTGGDRAVSQ